MICSGKTRRGIRSRRAITFVSMMVALSLLTIVFAVLYNLVSFGSRSSKRSMDLADANTISILVMEAIVKELKTSNRILYPRQRGVASWVTLRERDGRHKVIFLDKPSGTLKMRYLDEKEAKVLSHYGRDRPIFIKRLRFHNIKGAELFIKLSMAHQMKPDTTIYQMVTSFGPRSLY